jgi:branched-chain amino acid aminotransferase
MFSCWLYDFEQKTISEFPIVYENYSVDDFILTLPAGVYSTLRTVDKNKIFQFNYHLQRLRDSFKLSNLHFQYTIDEIREPLYNIIQKYPWDEVRIRIYIPFNSPNNCYLILEELSIPDSSAYEKGVMVNTNRLSRENPKAKLTSFIQKSEQIKRLCKNNNLEESIILNQQNELLEGLSSNFFAVVSGCVYTAENEVLSGATREIILDEIQKLGTQIIYKAIRYEQISIIEEAFISSTSRGVLPIIKINDQNIGNGKPGVFTKLIQEKLLERMRLESELILLKS